MKNFYHDRVNLLLKCLPIIAKQDCFALKGGTAINLFIRDDYPRASIDIDLTYIKLKSRDETLADIQKNLKLIKNNIEHTLKTVKVKEEINKIMNIIFKLEVQDLKVAIKIEPNLILRGFVYPPSNLNVSRTVQNLYGIGAEKIPVMSYADTYAGKICAALDRQHPRDLFDIGFIVDKPLNPELKNAFLIYLISNNRPMHELLSHNQIDINKAYVNEFVGMENISTSIEQLLDNRVKLIESIKNSLDIKDKEFLLSVKKGQPDFSLFPLSEVANLPGIKWKSMNIAKMDKAKHLQQIKKLEAALT